MLEILGPDGSLNSQAGADYQGMERFSARKIIAKKLEDEGLLVERKEYENNAGFSERADAWIEPVVGAMVSQILESRGSQTSREGRDDRILSQTMGKDLSPLVGQHPRLVHQPATLVGASHSGLVPQGKIKSDPSNWQVSAKGPSDPENWEQDEDVLDTWASSALAISHPRLAG